MSGDDEVIVICWPVEALPEGNVQPTSIRTTCATCGRAIWHAPDTAAAAIEDYGKLPKLMCVVCVVETIDPADVDIQLTPDQKRMLGQ